MNTKKYAYVTALTNAKYFPGVFALMRGLESVGAAHDLVVLVPEDRLLDLAPRLHRWGLRVLSAPRLEVRNSEDGEHYWDDTFFKVRAAGLTDYDKLVLLDSDMLVLKNLDHLFDMPHASAVVAGKTLVPEWSHLNSGLLVIVPDVEFASTLIECVEPTIHRRREAGLAAGDQDVFQQALPDWPTREHLHLPETYNTFFSDLDVLCKLHYSNGYRDVRIVHFIGAVKPWDNSSAREIRTMLSLVKRRKFVSFRARLSYLRLLRGWDR